MMTGSETGTLYCRSHPRTPTAMTAGIAIEPPTHIVTCHIPDDGDYDSRDCERWCWDHPPTQSPAARTPEDDDTGYDGHSTPVLAPRGPRCSGSDCAAQRQG
ncbi:hypothetical protein EDB83DRAFT_2317705 [Lactarius deliciosus]|nr:hypothetical protein EDB83DRAFT_2317705 [Lactarius deliciosus]